DHPAPELHRNFCAAREHLLIHTIQMSNYGQKFVIRDRPPILRQGTHGHSCILRDLLITFHFFAPATSTKSAPASSANMATGRSSPYVPPKLLTPSSTGVSCKMSDFTSVRSGRL